MTLFGLLALLLLRRANRLTALVGVPLCRNETRTVTITMGEDAGPTTNGTVGFGNSTDIDTDDGSGNSTDTGGEDGPMVLCEPIDPDADNSTSPGLGLCNCTLVGVGADGESVGNGTLVVVRNCTLADVGGGGNNGTNGTNTGGGGTGGGVYTVEVNVTVLVCADPEPRVSDCLFCRA